MTYLMPIRSASPVTPELVTYLASLVAIEHLHQVIVVDGSRERVFSDFHNRCPRGVLHVAVDPRFQHLANGKVAGVLTGLRLAAHDCVVIADDDVRYDTGAIAAVAAALERAEVVRPQNYFAPLPWHACLDTARTLVNRVTGGDWPGTLAVRRWILERTGGYDGDVLFENLELVRTVRAAGGRELCPLDLMVRRLPARTGHFWSQRVRQAYDEFARPARMVTWLVILPLLTVAVLTFGWRAAAAGAIAPMIVAEAGRRVAGGTRVFPLRATLCGPLWVLERAVCAWLAVASRVRYGGVRYRGRIMRRAATPYAVLLRRHAHLRGRAENSVQASHPLGAGSCDPALPHGGGGTATARG